MPEVEGIVLLRDIGSALRYRPNHLFFIRASSAVEATLALRCDDLPDARDPSKMIGLTVCCTVDLATIKSSLDALQAWVKVVTSFELHEMAEWLRHDDENVFDPHRYECEFGGMSWENAASMNPAYLSEPVLQWLNKGVEHSKSSYPERA